MGSDLTNLYKPASKKMLVAGFMSGTGSVLRKIIEKSNNYNVVVIFTDNYKSNAVKIGKDFDIPVIVRDIKSYCDKRNVSLFNMKVRKSFDLETCKILKCLNISTIAYAGYMSLITDPLINRYLNVNVHPADLTILNEEGERKYIGAHAVRDAMCKGEKYVRSTIHLITRKVDNGPILAMSENIELDYNKDVKYNQNRLKRLGDFKIFPQVLENIANGLYSKDYEDNIYFDNKIIKL